MAATKSDLPVRKVFEKEGREWAQSKGFPFFEVRAVLLLPMIGEAN